MEREEYIKEILIENAISLIAEGGFEKATTKNLAYHNQDVKDVKMNEVYIYRLFGSKEELYQTAFITLDKEFIDAASQALITSWGIEGNGIKKMYDFFLKVWHFVLNNEASCRCYVRCYYSVYFKGEALKKHEKNFNIIVDAFKPMFIEEADVTAIMQSIFTTLLDFAIRVYNGMLENTEENVQHVFNVVYCIAMTYLKNPEPIDLKNLI